MSAAKACKTAERRDGSGHALRARCEAEGFGRDCRILELSSRRAFVESFVPAVSGTRVTLQFQLPNGHQVCTAGVVKYHQFKVGFGVDLTDLTPRDRDQIDSLVG